MILSKLQLVENILNEISDNSTGQISPYDIRHNLLDVIDSVHLLLNEQNINCINFATPASRNTKAGDFTLENLNLNLYSSTDNSAFGFSALKANYQSERNTAVGSYSLSCNIYGNDNAALGYNSLGGNTTGFGNIGIGNYSLNNNKVGNFNIAIGHAAGYYADRLTCNKLFIASHPVDAEYICNNPLGSGLTPLVYGDLELNQFGINVNSLDSSGTLQVGGNITPSSGSIHDIGSENYVWNKVYSNSIYFGSGLFLSRDNSNIITNISIVPSGANSNLGSSINSWQHGYFNNITVSGTATFNRFNAYEHCEYFCKTIHLASSGTVEVIDGGGPNSLYDYAYQPNLIYSCPLLTDEEMSGAGIVASTSGVGYRRDYNFIFSPPSSNNIPCDNNGYARSSWVSNISIVLDSGVYLKTNRIVSYDSNCNGIFFDNGNTYFGRKNILDANPSNINGNIAGIGNINFIGNSGVVSDYISTFATLESGVSVSTRLLTGTKKRTKDPANSNKDVLTGFEIKFIDTGLQNLSIPSDRLVLGSYNNSSYMFNTAVLMKDGSQGIFGINNLGVLSEHIVPKTSLDIRTTGNAIIRSTAENQSRTIAALQLLGQQSCEYNGFEAAYLNTSGVADFSMFKDSGKQVFFRLYDNKSVGLFTSSGTSNAMLTLGDSINNAAAISFRRFTASNNPQPTQNYGKIFVKQKSATKQSDSLFFTDSEGNTFDLVTNVYSSDSPLVFTDGRQNTFAGVLSPGGREWVSRNPREIYANTGFGFMAGSDLSTPPGGFPNPEAYGLGNNNTLFGAYAGRSLVSGSGNIAIGSKALGESRFGFNNIVIGNNALLADEWASPTNHNIVIGHHGVGSGLKTNYNLLIGSSRNSILLHGILGPTNNDKHLYMPSGGKLSVYDNTNADSLSLRANVIEVRDFTGNNYPDNTLSFKFTGNQSADLFLLQHNAQPINKSANYNISTSGRPSAELRGDLKLLGAIRFSDNTSLESASQIDVLNNGLNNTNNNFNNLQSQFNSLVVEGTCSYRIAPPNDPSIPTSGNMIIRNTNWQDIGSINLVNRDKALNINAGDYVVAIKVNNEYRPLWVSNQNMSCSYCNN